jgi:hexulose-6-phosphate isomerase
MKIGASYWMFDGGLEGTLDPTKAIKQAKELGFDSIELCVAASGALTEKTSRQDCEDIVNCANETGIEISSVASGEPWTSSPSANDPAVREKIIEFTKNAMQVTNWLGADAYLFVPGSVDIFFLPDAEVIPYDLCYERASEAVEKILAAASSNNVTLCIENVWNKFLLSPLEMRDFIDSFNSNYVKSYFDVGNVLLTGYPEQWIKILGDRIGRVHIKDFKMSTPTVEGFVNLLEGDVDFEKVKTALAEVGYDSYVTAEILPYSDGKPEKTAQAMKKIFK